MRVFVTVGNGLKPFDRLLRAVDSALARYPGSFDGVCQHGPSLVRPRGLQAVTLVGRDVFAQEMEAADVVITHAGVGSVHTAIGSGHVPVILPRLAAYDEIVDDHQLELARAFGELGSILVVDGADAIEQALRDFLEGRRRRGPRRATDGPSPSEEVSRAIDAGRLARRPGRLRRAVLVATAALGPRLESLLRRDERRH